YAESAAGADAVVDVVARATAVAKVRPSADFEAISTSFKRMKNMLRQAQDTKKRVACPFNPELLQEDAEKKLAAEMPKVAGRVNFFFGEKQKQQNKFGDFCPGAWGCIFFF